MNAHKQIFKALALSGAILLVGTCGYMVIENYPALDAFYMTVITVTTVGFGEVMPLTDAGRIFTSFLILTGFCCLAFVSHSVVESVLSNVWRKSSEIKKMQKKIDKLKNHFVICGYGRVGEVAADHFRKAGADFVIIEGSANSCETIKEKEYLYIEGDATIEQSLLNAGIKQAKGLLALLGTDPDNLFIVLSARELNPTLRIVSRADKSTSEHKILQAGADNVISPYASAGQQIADDILLATGHNALLSQQRLNYNDLPQWIEVQSGSSMVKQTVAELSAEIGRQVIGVRRAGQDSIFPQPETKIMDGDALLVLDVLDEETKIQSQAPEKVKKIAIIDDNPVIVRLYVRLFQKAGFSPVTAANGQEGLELIKRENPAAAVVDYQLPILSGVEVCKKVRASNECAPNMQLILFTAHDDQQIHQQAIKAGADAVIVKSQNASEIIESVVQHLEKKIL